MIPSYTKQTDNTKNTVIYKRVFDKESIELFRQKLYEASCDDIEVSQNPEADKSFLNRISDLCNFYFPKEQQINLKSKDLQSPWITNGIKKFSNRKQRLYEKYLKNRNEKSELNTKFTKDFLNTLKKHSKKL